VTLESALPYVSIGCAIGAGAAAAVGPSPGVQRTLKAVALLALAVFAFLRGVAPAGLAMALTLSGLAWAFAPRERAVRGAVSTGLFVLAWLVLAWLCLREGVWAEAITAPIRLAPALLVVAATGGLLAWGRRLAAARLSWSVESVALGLLVLTALTLRDNQWPAMAGALALFAAHGVKLASALRPLRRLERAADIFVWALSYLGQAAMAYVFLR
jgi:hypothetical protein